MAPNKPSFEKTLKIPPAQLWLGNHDTLMSKLEQFLQKLWCKNNQCSVCFSCKQVQQQQHHAALWLRPEKTYTLDQLKPIFETITLARNPGEHFFFIIQYADRLTVQCANRLLKPIEEPPHGYYFILLAQRKDMLLPTIRSRCIIYTYATEQETNQHHNLMKYFVDPSCENPIEFLKELSTSKITEHETTELLDQLFEHWSKQYKQQLDTTTQKIVTILKNTIEQPIMPGSSKMVLRNLFLQIHS